MHYIIVEMWQRLQRAISNHDSDLLASWSIDTAERVAEVVRKSEAPIIDMRDKCLALLDMQLERLERKYPGR